MRSAASYVDERDGTDTDAVTGLICARVPIEGAAFAHKDADPETATPGRWPDGLVPYCDDARDASLAKCVGR